MPKPRAPDDTGKEAWAAQTEPHPLHVCRRWLVGTATRVAAAAAAAAPCRRRRRRCLMRPLLLAVTATAAAAAAASS